ncbi:hypothetical protein SESBI_29981 [Sesbania bispinosa]|nr:hypothetical protein SESBI_29981 [Sesbania bispinosa]
MTRKDKCVVLWSIYDHIATLAREVRSNVKQGYKARGNNEKTTESPSIGPRGIYEGHANTVGDVQFCTSR